MTAATASEVSFGMNEDVRCLERWRSQRERREQIPQPLLIVAGELAQEHGINPVSMGWSG